MTIDALAFIRRHGIVLESAKGPVPNLAEAIARTPVRGSWWSHMDSKDIFRASREVRDSKDVLVCRLIDGKITFVHRRLWPAVIRLAEVFAKDALTALREEHSVSGQHLLKKVPFPRWVPPAVLQRAKAMSEKKAGKQLGAWATSLASRADGAPTRRVRRRTA